VPQISFGQIETDLQSVNEYNYAPSVCFGVYESIELLTVHYYLVTAFITRCWLFFLAPLALITRTDESDTSALKLLMKSCNVRKHVHNQLSGLQQTMAQC
jgi:hypothetical protein